MLATVRSSVEQLRGVAGFSVVDTEAPGSAIEPHGGIQEDVRLDKVLIRMRASSLDAYGGKLIIACTKPEQEWRIARLSSVRGKAVTFVDDRVFGDEQDAQAEIFRMRLEEFPAEDGMPENFHQGYKRPGADNWGPV
ncbi:MAG: N,N-dimethylformamidase, small subunit [Nocardioidaceae bacterium]|nr:MAG: N,N-dimethylformamidase, small subunit [Nocardioidaceae bacterium]